MKALIHSALAVASLATIGAATSSALAAGPTNVNNCTTITTPGSYVLARNVSATGDCFMIRTNDVTFDFDGFTATGDGTGNGVYIEGRGVVVRNGTVRGFGTGITITTHGPATDYREGASVERMQVLDMTGPGVAGGFGTVRDSFVAGNGNTGIALGTGASIIMNNRVVGNSRAGMSAGPGSVVSGNTISFNNSSGTPFSSGLVAGCPTLVVNNTIVGQALNFSTLGAGCVVEHNVIGP